jgi:tripartite-type tricarboxylate transporter receptor subunit TctC
VVGCSGRATRLRIISGSGAGSTSSHLISIFARHLGRYGIQTSVEAVPRSGGKLAARHLLEAPADGTVMAMLPTGLLYADLLREEGMTTDLAAFQWIGNFSSDRRVFASRPGATIHQFQELVGRKRPMLLAAVSAVSASYYEAAIVRYLTGANIRSVPGYTGGARNLALISGEMDGVIASVDGLTKLLGMPGATVLLRLNGLSIPPGTAGAPERAPLLRDLARGADAPALLDLIEEHAQLGRIVAMAPDTPSVVVDRWRTLFDQVIGDLAFRREAAAAGFVVGGLDGATVANMLKDLLYRRRSSLVPALRRAIAAQPPIF